MTETAPFLGRGWAFPPSFGNGGKELALVADVEDILQSLEILFGTRLGERIMQEEYGSSLEAYQFEEITSGVLNSLRAMIEDAVLYHEPRIRIEQVDVQIAPDQDGLLLIELDFTVPSSNSRYNMVYPFYITEANT